MTGRLFLILLAAVFASSMGVVYAKHESRKAFVELQRLHKQRDDMDAEWGRLQLEQAAWATHGRVETTARARLNMVLPTADKVVIVRP